MQLAKPMMLGVALLGMACAQAQTTPKGEWRTFEQEGTNTQLAELGYFISDDVHAEPYITCNEGSGWVTVTHDLPDSPTDEMRLTSGRETIDLPIVKREAQGLTMEAMIPAEHAVLEEATLGRSLSINGNSYPVGSAED